jgi:hypothetical protein
MNLPPGAQTPPGVGSQYYGRTGYKWEQPGPAETMLPMLSDQLDQNPSRAKELYDKYLRESGPSAIETLYAMTGRAGPGFGEKFIESNIGRLKTPGAAQDYWSGVKGEMAAPGALEDLWGSGQLQKMLGEQGMYESGVGGLMSEAGEATSLRDFWKRYGERQLGESGYTEQMAQRYRPELSFSEELLTGGEGERGLDKLYSRLFEKGERELGEAAAARGGFASGAGLRSIQELQMDLSADEIAKNIALAEQADVQKMARFGEARGLMTGADEALRGRLATGFTGARGVDEIQLAKAKTMADILGEGQKFGMERAATMGKLAGETQAAYLARMMGGGTLAKDAEEFAARGREKAIAAAAERDRLRREREEEDRLLASAASTEGRLGRSDLMRFTGDVDLTTERRLGFKGDIVKTLQDLAEGRRTGGMTAAVNAETLDVARTTRDFEDTMRIADTLSTMALNEQDKAIVERAKYDLEAIQAQLEGGKISAADATAKTNNILATLNTMLNAYSALRK